MLDLIEIARICHETNRGYCEAIGDNSQVSWDSAPEWQQQSAINGVEFHFYNNVTPEQSHQNWMKEKLENGWTFGDVKNEVAKTHPCMVPYSELPQLQRTKDFIFKAIVDSYK